VGLVVLAAVVAAVVVAVVLIKRGRENPFASPIGPGSTIARKPGTINNS
jgi:preprotein translocase subunit SecG